MSILFKKPTDAATPVEHLVHSMGGGVFWRPHQGKGTFGGSSRSYASYFAGTYPRRVRKGIENRFGNWCMLVPLESTLIPPPTCPLSTQRPPFSSSSLPCSTPSARLCSLPKLTCCSGGLPELPRFATAHTLHNCLRQRIYVPVL